jgi:DNA-binding response OmpR family regulator
MPKKILIIEDDQFSASIYKSEFEKNNFQVTIAADGAQALSLADSFQPDLIILDLILPKLDGYSLLKIFQNTSPHHKTPIIVVSNLDQESDISTCHELGATHFFAKNELNFLDLLAAAKALL